MNARACQLSLLALLVVGACTGADGAVTAPAHEGGVRLERLVAMGDSQAPLDAWMGSAPDEAIRVRVVNASGAPVAGARVRFAVANDGARFGRAGTSAHDSAIVVLSDGHGIATVTDWMLPVRDTVATRHTLVARVEGRDAAGVTFVARAWRDLTRFGGSAPAVFENLPIDRQQLAAILPLGTLGRDDALPSTDALLIARAGAAPVVRAMSDGLVIDVDEAAGAITMRVRDDVRVRVGGVTLRRGLWVGRVVHAGDTLGMLDLSRPDAALALRVFDASVQRANWVRGDRYGARRSAVFFARYLAADDRSAAFALVRRAAPDLEGRIDYDQAGRLVGTWFDPASPAIATATQMSVVSPFAAMRVSELDPSAAIAPVALTFAYDAERPGQVRIAAGSTLAATLGVRGVRAVAWEDPDPAAVGVSTGVVRYHLFSSEDARIGLAESVLLVQLLDEGMLRAEIVPARGAESAGFSSRAITLIR